MRTCLDCGVTIRGGRRTGCPAHQAVRDRIHNAGSTRVYHDPVYRSIPLVGPCHLCGANPAVDPTRDHVIPIAAGGTNDPANIRIACRSCNSSRNRRRGLGGGV
jgi:5-methylcytosine-specific restriction protein A